LQTVQKLSLIILTVSASQISKSKAIDDTSLQGIYKLSQSWVIARLSGASFLNRARNSRCTVITDLDTSKQSTQKAFSHCDAILETGPAVSVRSELLVMHEKLGQLLLLMVYVVPV